MPMLDVQRRHAEVFRVRLGDKGPRGEPRKLTDAIRVTAGGANVVQSFVDVYGGEVAPFEEKASRHNWQAYLPTTALSVMVLPGQSLDAWWELYRGSVCERRCDGFTEQLSGQACMCPPEIDKRMAAKNTCRPMTRINVLCPDVEVVGAGSLVTHGMIAAETLPQSIKVAEAALSRGLMVPAVLRVVEHKGKRHFIFPQLEIVGVSLQQLARGEVERLALAAPVSEIGQVSEPAAIGSGGAGVVPPSTPTPRPLPPPLPGEDEPAPDDGGGTVDWVARINKIGETKTRSACMKGFKAVFPDLTVPADQVADAEEILAMYETASPPVDEREKLRRGLMATAGKAFPDMDAKTRDEARHAVIYAVLGEHRSTNDMTAEELTKVTLWLNDVERGVVRVGPMGDGRWVLALFDGEDVVVPSMERAAS